MPSKPTSRQRSPDLSLAWLAKQREQLDERAAARARTEAMLNESIEEFKYDDGEGDGDGWGESAENALGKESSEKLKAALSRVGGDLNAEGGYRFFRHSRKEREFDEAWIKGVDWLKGVDGILFGRVNVDCRCADEDGVCEIRVCERYVEPWGRTAFGDDNLDVGA